MLHLQQLPTFPVTGEGCLATRWERWKKSFEYYIIASGVKDESRKRCLLLCNAGVEVQDIFETLETGTSYQEAITALDGYFAPHRNLPYERYNFSQCSQHSDETIDSFVSRLKSMVRYCEFNEYDNETAIIDQVIRQTTSTAIRKQLIKESAARQLNLNEALTICRSIETSKLHTSDIEKTAKHNDEPTRESLNKLSGNNAGKESSSGGHGSFNRSSSSSSTNSKSNSTSSSSCFNCGGNHRRGLDSCPAKGAECYSCGKMNHYSRVCRGRNQQQQKQNVRNVNDTLPETPDYKSDGTNNNNEPYVFKVNDTNKRNRTDTELKVEGVTVGFLIDSGASVNILDFDTFNEIKQKTGIKATSTKTRLFQYASNEPIRLIGSVQCLVEISHRLDVINFIIVEDKHAGNIIGRQTAEKLGLLKIGDQNDTENIRTISNKRTFEEEIFSQYPSAFNGVGKLKKIELQLHIDQSITPVAQKFRRIPFHLLKIQEEKVDELIELGIVEKVSDPTGWVSPLTCVTKPDGETRVCIDLRTANEAIKRVHHPIPTITDALNRLEGAKLFSKVDLKWGYHQIPLENESRNITAFQDTRGLYRYTRLPYGIKSASEEYNEIIRNVFRNCEGVMNIYDDIIIFGENTEEHDKNLRNFLDTMIKNGLTANKKKCIFRKTSINFFGFHISDKGIQPTENHMQAIDDFKEPTNVTEARSFLGTVNYVSSFVPNLATLAEPIRRITRKNCSWVWKDEQRTAFNQIKKEIKNCLRLSKFSTSRKTTVICDASPVGLGALLVQEDTDGTIHPIMFASRTLSQQEKKYCQTEKEALAVVWSVEKFHIYLYGAEFDMLTDHKALEVIYSPKGKPSARIERWSLRLQPYRMNIKYRPGANNPADFLSRSPTPTDRNSDHDEHIRYVTINNIPKAIPMSKLLQAAETDNEYKLFRDIIETNKWGEHNLTKPYKSEKGQFAVKYPFILKGKQLFIPRSLQQQTLRLAHEGHSGIVRTKELLKTKVWWPSMNKDVETFIKNCTQCNAVNNTVKDPPIIPTNMPNKPWEILHMDICGPFPDGKYMFAIIDEYSRWPECYVYNTCPASSTIIKSMKYSFATHGIPAKAVTDNGSQFVSRETKNYFTMNGIQHRRVTPYWPRANGQAERLFKTLKKTIKTAMLEGTPWTEALNNYLLLHRNTPNRSSGKSPAMLLMNRELRSKIPSIENHNAVSTDKRILAHDKRVKEYNRNYAEKRFNHKGPDISVGDTVLLKQKMTNKFCPAFNPDKLVVIKVSGYQITAKRLCDNVVVIRNCSYFKKIPGGGTRVNINVHDDDDDFEQFDNQRETNSNTTNINDTRDNNIELNNSENELNNSDHIVLRGNPLRSCGRPERYTC